MLRTSALPALLTAALVAGLLGGCSDDDPKPEIADPTPSVASTPAVPVSASPTTPSPSARPEQVVTAWIDARNRALKSGETTEVDALSTSDCKSCEELNGPIRTVYQAGGKFETAGWRIDSIKTKPGADPIEVDTALTFAAGKTIPAAGADPVTYDEEKHIVSFRLLPAGDSFKVQLVLFR